MHPIARGWGRPGEQDPSTQFHVPSPSQACRHQRACLCCYGTAYVPQEVVMGVVADRLIEILDLASIALALFQEQHVMDRVTSDAIGTHLG